MGLPIQTVYQNIIEEDKNKLTEEGANYIIHESAKGRHYKKNS